MSEFRMPEAHVGQPVLYHMGGHKAPGAFAALVTRVNHRSVGLAVFTPDNQNHLCREGVRHADDPELKDDDRTEGVWEYTTATRKVRDLEAALAQKGK